MFSAYSPASASDFGTVSVLVFTVTGVPAGALLTFGPALFALVSLCDDGPDEHAPTPSTKRKIRPGITGLFLLTSFLISLLFISILPSSPKIWFAAYRTCT